MLDMDIVGNGVSVRVFLVGGDADGSSLGRYGECSAGGVDLEPEGISQQFDLKDYSCCQICGEKSLNIILGHFIFDFVDRFLCIVEVDESEK